MIPPPRLLSLLILASFPYWIAPANRCLGQSFANAVPHGMVTAPEIVEASGIVASRQNPGVLWTHNDSGFGGSVFALSTNGALLGRYYVPTAFGGNYEDIAIGPGPNPDHQYLYLGDIGDGFLSRFSIRVFRFPEPAIYLYQSNAPPVLPTVGAQEIELRYPDGPFDAEALMVDPWTGDLFIATKQTNIARLYRATRADLDGGGPVTLTFIRQMSFSGFRSVSAADISADGRLIAMRRNGRAWVWNRALNQSVGDALAATGITAPVAEEPNGEAIGFHPTGLGYYTISEDDIATGLTTNYFIRRTSGVPAQPAVFIRPGDTWRYQDTGADEGTAWRHSAFNDAAWSSGLAQLGYGQGDERTVVSYGIDDFEKHTTTYFRKQFTRPSSVTWTNVALRVCFTDGVAVYLNGTEVLRRNLPPNAAFNQLATASNAERQNFWVSVPVNPALIVSGANTVAVEVHRMEPWGPALSFDLQLLEGGVEQPMRFTGPPRLNAGIWRISIAGPAGSLARIEACDDLASWIEIGQVVLTGGVGQYQESAGAATSRRFYRLRN
jgi:hypothetical protein